VFALNEKTMGGTKQKRTLIGNLKHYKSCISQTTPKAKFKRQEVYPLGD
jgi:hypothetical protein